MASCRKHIQAIASALDIRLAINSIYQIIVNLHCNRVGIRVVVSEERRAVHDKLAQLLFAFPVLRYGLQQRIHIDFLVLEDVLLQDREAVGCRAETRALDIGRVVARTAIVVVFSAFDTVVDEQRKEGCRRILGKHTVDVVAYAHLLVDNEVKLLQVSLIQFVVRLECPRVARFEADFRPCYRVDTVIQGNFQNLRHIQITSQQVSLFTEGSYFDTAAAPTFASIFQALALAQ